MTCKIFPFDIFYTISSSVYGGNTQLPFSEKQLVDHPVSLYAATKKSNELLAHSYSHLYSIPSTGLRFFTVTVLGVDQIWPFSFTKSILNGEPIKVFSREMTRDFTYSNDVVESIVRLMKATKPSDSFNSFSPRQIKVGLHIEYLIWKLNTESLSAYIEAIENTLGIKAKNFFHAAGRCVCNFFQIVLVLNHILITNKYFNKWR